MQNIIFQSHDIEVTPTEKEQIKKELPESLRSARQLVDMELKNRIDTEKYLGTEDEIDLGPDIQQGLADYVGAKGRFTPIVSYIELGLDNSLLKGMEVIDTPGLDDPVIARSKVTKKPPREMYKVVNLNGLAVLKPENANFIITNNIFSMNFKLIKPDVPNDTSYEVFFIDAVGHVLGDRQLVEVRNG